MDTFELPPRKTLDELLAVGCSTQKPKPYFGKSDTTLKHPRKAGQAWTDEEHLAFLAGLKALGRGNWRGIARDFVPSRTSTQIASHAQKYMARQQGATKRKSKFTDLEQNAHQYLDERSAASRKRHSLNQRTCSGSNMAAIPPLTGQSRGFEGRKTSPQESACCRDESPELHKPKAIRYTEPAELIDIAGSLVSLKEGTEPRPQSGHLQINQGSAFHSTRLPNLPAEKGAFADVSKEQPSARPSPSCGYESSHVTTCTISALSSSSSLETDSQPQRDQVFFNEKSIASPWTDHRA